MDVAEIREKFKKPIEDPFFNKHVTRPIAYYVSWPFIMLRIHPTLLNLSTIAIGIIACIFFAWGWFITGALLGHIRNIVDHVDGVVARAAGLASSRGKYIDRVAQHVSDPLMFIGIAWGLYSLNPQNSILFAGISAALSMLLLHLFLAERLAILGEEKEKTHATPLRPQTPDPRSQITNHRPPTTDYRLPASDHRPRAILSFLKACHDKIGFLFRDPALLNIILLAVLFNQLEIMLLFYGVTMPLLAFGTLVHEYVAFYR